MDILLLYHRVVRGEIFFVVFLILYIMNPDPPQSVFLFFSVSMNNSKKKLVFRKYVLIFLSRYKQLYQSGRCKLFVLLLRVLLILHKLYFNMLISCQLNNFIPEWKNEEDDLLTADDIQRIELESNRIYYHAVG